MFRKRPTKFKLNEENIKEALLIYREYAYQGEYSPALSQEEDLERTVKEVMDNSARGQSSDLRLGWAGPGNGFAKLLVIINESTLQRHHKHYRHVEYLLDTHPNYAAHDPDQGIGTGAWEKALAYRAMIIDAWEKAGFPVRKR